MLRRVRISRFITLCWLAALGWVTAGMLGMLSAAGIGEIVTAGAGLFTVALLCHVGRQVNAQQGRQRRTDRQLGAAASVLRDGFHREGLGAYILPGLEDDRASLPGGAQVTELRPRVTPAHRQPRSRRRKP